MNPKEIFLCSICNVTSGNCAEDCKYCTQSSHYHTNIPTYKNKPIDSILQEARSLKEYGALGFCLVTSGRGLDSKKCEYIAQAARAIKEADLGLHIIACCGRADLDSLKYLKANGVKIQYVGNGYGNFSENDRRIILMTYHSAKGLDFDNVFIPFANNNLYISPDESMAKTLFMVAMTRARKNLYISYYGYPSDYLDAFRSNCAHIDISTSTVGKMSTTNNDNNPWGF